MMRHAATFIEAGFGRTDIHPAVNLTGVGIDDFSAQPLCNPERDRALTGGGRSDD